jgi:alanine racemase
MDQVVVDCGADGGGVAVGDRAVLFGPGDRGEPTAQDWADELGTIHYEVVTGVHGRRVQRTAIDPAAPPAVQVPGPGPVAPPGERS